MKAQPLLYADRELGAYGYEEKPWFLPHLRLEAFLAEIERKGLASRTTRASAPPATDAELQLFHTRAHVEHVRARCATNEGALDHGPTFARAHVERAARFVAGAVLDATRRVLAGEATRAFVPIAGFHHAYPDAARLYCLYNDPALAIAYALQELEGHVAYVDIDIHQGDGVYLGYEAEPRVWIADLHEDPRTLFPFTPEAPGEGPMPGRREERGRGAALGTKLNIPLEPYTNDEAYLALWEEAEAHLRAARPELVIFECGVDGLEADPLSNQRLGVAAIAEVARRVRAIADEHASGRLLVLGGGGYELGGLAQGWSAALEALVEG